LKTWLDEKVLYAAALGSHTAAFNETIPDKKEDKWTFSLLNVDTLYQMDFHNADLQLTVDKLSSAIRDRANKYPILGTIFRNGFNWKENGK